MYYGALKKKDIANGPGVRVSLFVSGCTHHCPGCFNTETWDFEYGTPFSEETIEEILQALAPAYISGLTLLGGEPMERLNQAALIPLVQRVRTLYPAKSIWCFSGYTFETDLLPQWRHDPETSLLSYIDVLVDGEFKLEQKNIQLQFRGSENQRIICIPESLNQQETVLWSAARF